MIFLNKLFKTIYKSICSCIPNVIFNIFGFSKVIYVLSCLIASAIIVTASILFCTVCIAVSNELPKTGYLPNVFFDMVWKVWPGAFDGTVSTSLANIHTHTKPTKITTVHDFPVQQRPRPQAAHMWSPGGKFSIVHHHGFSTVRHPMRLCNRNDSLLLGYSPRIDTGLHWHKYFSTRINGVLFEFSERAYPVQPNHLRIYTQVNIRGLVVIYNL